MKRNIFYIDVKGKSGYQETFECNLCGYRNTADSLFCGFDQLGEFVSAKDCENVHICKTCMVALREHFTYTELHKKPFF